MNGIEENPFTQRLAALGRELPRPRAILVVSAHWLTAGTWVTAMERPRTIHDFGGFPEELFAVEYPAPGSSAVAKRVQELLPHAHLDRNWGLDHGTWTLLLHMYPSADIPVLQLSLDMSESPLRHLEIASRLRGLRDEGVLIVGSGNVTQNLRRLSRGAPLEWAREFDAWVKEKIIARDFVALASDFTKTLAGQLSVPTPDHYLPLLYVLGASDQSDVLRWEYEAMELGSLSMRSFGFGEEKS